LSNLNLLNSAVLDSDEEDSAESSTDEEEELLAPGSEEG
jgi:hypothetical protein